MTEITTFIDIAQPAELVWRILMDFPRYGEWNPFIAEISGERARGGKLKVLLNTEPGKQMTFRPKVVAYEENQELVWQGHFLVPGIFDGRHRFKLIPTGHRAVRFEHGESFRGLLLPLLRPLLAKTRLNFEAMNQALKQRAEAAPR